MNRRTLLASAGGALALVGCNRESVAEPPLVARRIQVVRLPGGARLRITPLEREDAAHVALGDMRIAFAPAGKEFGRDRLLGLGDGYGGAPTWTVDLGLLDHPVLAVGYGWSGYGCISGYRTLYEVMPYGLVERATVTEGRFDEDHGDDTKMTLRRVGAGRFDAVYVGTSPGAVHYRLPSYAARYVPDRRRPDDTC